MNVGPVHKLLVACSVAVGFLATPSESQAIFHWFGRCCAPRATYLPVAPVQTCAPVCPQSCTQQVCNYVPQTCYRTQMISVPVTAYQPVRSCDPCTGCPVTSYRPVVSYVQRVQRVPYTTYRMVCSTQQVAPAATAVSYTQPAAPGCTSCAPGATITTPAPAITTPAPATTVPQTTVPQTFTPDAATQQPSLRVPSSSSNTVPRTFAEEPTTGTSSYQPPIPDASPAPNYSPQPRLIDPDARTTFRPITTTVAGYQQAPQAYTPSTPQNVHPVYRPMDAGGWVASQR